jgi:hypothetical protein
MLPDITPLATNHEPRILDICIWERVLLTSTDTARDFRRPVIVIVVFFFFFFVFVGRGTCQRLFLSRRGGLVK